MVNEVFADGIGRIDFAAGVVRFDLVTVEPAVEGGKSRLEARQRVMMPLEGFLAAIGTMTNLANKLVEAGVLRPNPAASAEAAPATESKGKTKAN